MKKIYVSESVNSITFYANSVTIIADKTIEKNNAGISFILFNICNGINDVSEIAKKISEQFYINTSLDEIIEKILVSTMTDEELGEIVTCDISRANLFPNTSGVFGMRYPKLVHIELTNICNFKCTHCYKNALSEGAFMDLSTLERYIYAPLKGIVPIIHFTGGEPTLHKHFEKIVHMFQNGFLLQLTTNGSRIKSYPVEIFECFQAIDISLYGLSSKEYGENTGHPEAFEFVKENCCSLHERKIDYRITTVLNKHNMYNMENYIRFAIEVGASSVSFSLPMQSGRAMSTLDNKWNLTPEDRRYIYRSFRELQIKYHDEIHIKEWYRSNYSNMWKFYPLDDSLRCGAGKNDWWISEKFRCRPCSFLPPQYIDLEYESWIRYIAGQEEIDWAAARNSLEHFAVNNKFSITDICPIFKK